MKKPTDADIDAVFIALSHQTRRHVLVLLAQRGEELSSSYLAARFQHSWPTTTRHLKVLEEAGLVTVQYEGRSSRYRLERERLAGVLGSWLRYLEPVGAHPTWKATGPRTTQDLRERAKRPKPGQERKGKKHEHEQLDRKDFSSHG